MGDLTLALGMKISRDRENKILKISQRKYLEACLKRFDLENLHSVTTPGYIGDLHDNNGALLDTPLNVQDTYNLVPNYTSRWLDVSYMLRFVLGSTFSYRFPDVRVQWLPLLETPNFE
jgi:hypothetical protein